jgi:uncharacterized membrane-anchored protein YitT (DUF2179 family)
MGEREPVPADDWQHGLAAAIAGGVLSVVGAVGLVFNVLVATAGRSIMSRTDARQHGVSTAVILLAVAWVVIGGIRAGGRGPLGQVGRASLGLAAVLWVLFAVGQAFVLAPLW